jgi:hypothetical protein
MKKYLALLFFKDEVMCISKMIKDIQNIKKEISKYHEILNLRLSIIESRIELLEKKHDKNTAKSKK